jgi:hypothetical protein
MTGACTLSTFLPDEINFFPLLESSFPATFFLSRDGKTICWQKNEEMEFVDREIIPRIFAELVGLVALANFAANLTIAALGLLFLPFTLCDEENCCFALEKVIQNLFWAMINLYLGSAVLYGWLSPESIFYVPEKKESEQLSVGAAEVQISEQEKSPPGDSAMAASLQVEELLVVAAEQEIVISQTFKSIALESVKTPVEKPALVEAALPQGPVADTGVKLQVTTSEQESPPAELPPKAAEKPQATTPQREEEKAVVVVSRYAALEMTKDQEKAISDTLLHLSTKNPAALWLMEGDLDALGEKVRPVHTLKLLEFMLNDKTARKRLTEISKFTVYSIIWKGFIWGKERDKSKEEGIAGTLKMRARLKQIEEYIPDFAAAVKVNVEHLKPFAKEGNWEKADWEAMIKFLLKDRK